MSANGPRTSTRASAEPMAAGWVPAPGYEVIGHLSRGRRLDVYDAWSFQRASRCVLKLLRPERRGDDAARRKLVREGELLCSLTHPHIVRGYVTIRGPEPIVVMETLGGETFSHLIESREEPLAPAEIGHLGLHLTSAVSYLHVMGVLHLDLKPDNVVAEGGRAKLIDLSLAREPGPSSAGIGTWCYLAPEQARGGELGPPADVWGIGATLFEAATGEPAFDDPDDRSSATRSSSEPTSDSQADRWSDPQTRPSWDSGGSDDPWEGDYPQLTVAARPTATVRALPEPLCALIDSCLSFEPKARPTVIELHAGLELIAELPEAERRFS